MPKYDLMNGRWFRNSGDGVVEEVNLNDALAGTGLNPQEVTRLGTFSLPDAPVADAQQGNPLSGMRQLLRPPTRKSQPVLPEWWGGGLDFTGGRPASSVEQATGQLGGQLAQDGTLTGAGVGQQDAVTDQENPNTPKQKPYTMTPSAGKPAGTVSVTQPAAAQPSVARQHLQNIAASPFAALAARVSSQALADANKASNGAAQSVMHAMASRGLQDSTFAGSATSAAVAGVQAEGQRTAAAARMQAEQQAAASSPMGGSPEALALKARGQDLEAQRAQMETGVKQQEIATDAAIQAQKLQQGAANDEASLKLKYDTLAARYSQMTPYEQGQLLARAQEFGLDSARLQQAISESGRDYRLKLQKLGLDEQTLNWQRDVDYANYQKSLSMLAHSMAMDEANLSLEEKQFLAQQFDRAIKNDIAYKGMDLESALTKLRNDKDIVVAEMNNARAITVVDKQQGGQNYRAELRSYTDIFNNTADNTTSENNNIRSTTTSTENNIRTNAQLNTNSLRTFKTAEDRIAKMGEIAKMGIDSREKIAVAQLMQKDEAARQQFSMDLLQWADKRAGTNFSEWMKIHTYRTPAMNTATGEPLPGQAPPSGYIDVSGNNTLWWRGTEEEYKQHRKLGDTLKKENGAFARAAAEIAAGRPLDINKLFGIGGQ